MIANSQSRDVVSKPYTRENLADLYAELGILREQLKYGKRMLASMSDYDDKRKLAYDEHKLLTKASKLAAIIKGIEESGEYWEDFVEL